MIFPKTRFFGWPGRIWPVAESVAYCLIHVFSSSERRPLSNPRHKQMDHILRSFLIQGRPRRFHCFSNSPPLFSRNIPQHTEHTHPTTLPKSDRIIHKRNTPPTCTVLWNCLLKFYWSQSKRFQPDVTAECMQRGEPQVWVHFRFLTYYFRLSVVILFYSNR